MKKHLNTLLILSILSFVSNTAAAQPVPVPVPQQPAKKQEHNFTKNILKKFESLKPKEEEKIQEPAANIKKNTTETKQTAAPQQKIEQKVEKKVEQKANEPEQQPVKKETPKTELKPKSSPVQTKTANQNGTAKKDQQTISKEKETTLKQDTKEVKTAPVSQPKPIFTETKQQTQQTAETKKTPDKIAAINDMREQAKFLYNSNELEESKKLFNQIPDAEKISDDWLFLANIAQDNGKDIDAVFYLKKAIQADDKNYKAHYNLGNIYFADNKINMALAEYRKVLRIKKDYAYAYYNKGCCYLKNGSWYNARYEFGLAIKSNPDEPAFYYNLAYANKMLKKTEKAKEALEMYNKLMSK